jgi:PhnB protein
VNATNTYLIFDGECRDAMQFYAKNLGADLQLIPYSDAPMPAPPTHKDRIMHARLANGKAVLMASDSGPGMPVKKGDNFSINIACDNEGEISKLFGAFSDGAQKITMPLQETFWAQRFGMLTDKFGVNWMFNLEKPQH